MEGVCEVLEDTRAIDAEGEKDKQLNAYKTALNSLLRLVREFCEDLELRARVLVVVAGHSGPHYWTNTTNRQLANELLSVMCTACGHLDCHSLLAGERGLVAAIFNYLKGVLTKESWQHHPVHKQALLWVVKHLKHPNLGPYLAFVLPPTLWMLDDHSDYHRILALSLITHIIDNVDSTELRWQGKAELLYQAMKPLLYISSSELVYALHPCLLKLLPVLDYSLHSPAIPVKLKTIDEVFSILLGTLAKESKVSLQKAYTAQLKGYILQLGILNTRYIKQVLPLLLSGLEYSDPNEDNLRRLSLQALSALISSTWPRSSTYKFTVVNSLSKLIKDLSPNTTVPETSSSTSTLSDENGIIHLVVDCLSLLMAACPELKDELSVSSDRASMFLEQLSCKTIET